MTSLPGWTSKIKEISNGVFTVTLTDSFGRKAEITDAATEETIQKTFGYAFDIEKQISKNWGKFLLDFCSLQFADTVNATKVYTDHDAGSWSIELGDKRLLYDGKSASIAWQIKRDHGWFDHAIIRNDELTYGAVLSLLQQMK